MKALMIITTILLCLGYSGCRTNQPPDHMMIETAFFKCNKCKSLEGGVYGKGPFKSLHSPQAQKCVHDWQRIDITEFKTLAIQWQGVDWNNQIPFWSTGKER